MEEHENAEPVGELADECKDFIHAGVPAKVSGVGFEHGVHQHITWDDDTRI